MKGVTTIRVIVKFVRGLSDDEGHMQDIDGTGRPRKPTTSRPAISPFSVPLARGTIPPFHDVISPSEPEETCGKPHWKRYTTTSALSSFSSDRLTCATAHSIDVPRIVKTLREQSNRKSLSVYHVPLSTCYMPLRYIELPLTHRTGSCQCPEAQRLPAHPLQHFGPRRVLCRLDGRP